MQTDLADDACWCAALRLLDGGAWERAASRLAPRVEAAKVRGAPIDACRECVVRVLDRLSTKVVVVYWCDATSCRYGDQLWRVGVSRRRGRCALSGAPIKAGDVVYRPRQGRPRPVNATAMMLASEVERVSPG
ncbi:hypothetical protein R69658_02012 [Paraburkholderia aspalathi]|uniref:DUF3331 domain-containing protein n=1 Tax=Paraburkholderia aspalathi TaxID=1324617 RepID=A0ABM8R6L5_9BURK|nr:DUF3331 domain-containing protein [Paraburkholderia aspalathi]MBK3818868.1 DUF3331 domain-containing protein [Paraburkholderia aspalathi]MBK3830661.1 DUF3331 domain-containing protein [Paraburkholderia aspalathi]MBK3860362.1 DUF3331 domain-containing protein [Paraburkholderia aspalathi]CAE6735529.1 hypothetical protein R69658_02012 [Paraburkholderia aspalathi]